MMIYWKDKHDSRFVLSTPFLRPNESSRDASSTAALFAQAPEVDNGMDERDCQ